MLLCLLLGAALSVGQSAPPEQPAPSEAPAEASPPPKLADTGPVSVPTPAPPSPDRWLLMKALQGTWYGAQLDENRLNLYGWADMTYTASTDRRTNLPLAFNYVANDFLLQQNYIRFERTVVTSGTSEPTFGFRFDNIIGSDYRFTVARGLFDGQLTASPDGRPNRYGYDPVQFYGEAYIPTIGQGLDIKLGRFFCQYGVENIAAVENMLESKPYTFEYNPFTHTGVLSTLKLTSALSVQAGMVLGSDVFIAPEARPTFCGSVKWADPSGRQSVQLSTILGPGRFEQQQNFNNPEVFDFIYTHQVNARLVHTFEALFGFQTHVTDIGTEREGGVVNYLTYTFTPRLSGTARLEFFDDAQGQRTGFKGLYEDLTLGLLFKLRKGIIFRPEIRGDYNGQSRPFENKHGLFTATADLILRW